MNNSTILIVDDEPQIQKMLTITLESVGYRVVVAGTGKEALQMVASHPPELVLLDLGLPDLNGHEVLRHLREWFTGPIIILSVQSVESEIISALDKGANDYLVKPFRTGELLARIRSAVRTVRADSNSVGKFGDLFIDYSLRVVRLGDVPIKLTVTEYALLLLFAKNEGKVLTHQYLLQQIWGPSYTDQSQYLRVFVAQLRKKIEKDVNRPKHIITESGVGYRFLGN